MDQDRPALPPNDGAVREALEGAGVDMTGMARTAAGNSRVSNPGVDASTLAEYAGTMGVSATTPSVAFREGTRSNVDATVLEKLAEWRARNAAIENDRAQIQAAQKAIAGIRQDQVDAERARQQRKADKRDARDKARKEPKVREAHARVKAMKAMRKHLAAGHDVPSTVEHGYARYREHGGKANLSGFKNYIETGGE